MLYDFDYSRTTVSAHSAVIGTPYTIAYTDGATDFVSIGAPNNTVGTKFVATARVTLYTLTRSSGGAINTNTITFSSVTSTNLNGWSITGTGIPSGTTVLSGAGTNNLTLSNNFTAQASGSYTLTTTESLESSYGKLIPFYSVDSVETDTRFRKLELVTDITSNVRFMKDILSSVTLYDEYDIKDGESPEIISEKFYGSPEYHWVIMLANERYDYITDFPLSTHSLEEHITNTYGSGNEYDTHHYVDYAGYLVSSDNPQATSVSNYQYEDELNESKRRIKIISSDLLNTILTNYKDLL